MVILPLIKKVTHKKKYSKKHLRKKVKFKFLNSAFGHFLTYYTNTCILT